MYGMSLSFISSREMKIYFMSDKSTKEIYIISRDEITLILRTKTEIFSLERNIFCTLTSQLTPCMFDDGA